MYFLWLLHLWKKRKRIIITRRRRRKKKCSMLLAFFFFFVNAIYWFLFATFYYITYILLLLYIFFFLSLLVFSAGCQSFLWPWLSTTTTTEAHWIDWLNLSKIASIYFWFGETIHYKPEILDCSCQLLMIWMVFFSVSEKLLQFGERVSKYTFHCLIYVVWLGLCFLLTWRVK